MAQQPYTMSSPSVQVAQVAKDRTAQNGSRAGVASANPPSTNLPASVHLASDAPPPIPATGYVPFVNPVETPRAAEGSRVANSVPPTMSVNLTEGWINEAVSGHEPLMPNLIVQGGVGQVETNARPGASDGVLSGPNAVGSGPIITPSSPAVTMPVVLPPSPESNFE